MDPEKDSERWLEVFSTFFTAYIEEMKKKRVQESQFQDKFMSELSSIRSAIWRLK